MNKSYYTLILLLLVFSCDKSNKNTSRLNIELGVAIISSGERIYHINDSIILKDNSPLLTCHCHFGNSIFHTCDLSSGCFHYKCAPPEGSLGCGVFYQKNAMAYVINYYNLRLS